MQPGGGFLSVWEDEAVDDVHVRRFNAQGAPLTVAKDAAAGGLRQEAPDIGTAADGSAVITWTRAGDVFARAAVDAAGDPVGGASPSRTRPATQEAPRSRSARTAPSRSCGPTRPGEDDLLHGALRGRRRPGGDFARRRARRRTSPTPTSPRHPTGRFSSRSRTGSWRGIFARRYEPTATRSARRSPSARTRGFGQPRRGQRGARSGFTVAFELEDGEVVSTAFDAAGTPLTNRPGQP